MIAIEPAPDSAAESLSEAAVAIRNDSSSLPGATIDVRAADAAGAVIVAVAGVIGHNDAAVLGRLLHAQIDTGATVVVIKLRDVTSCHQLGVETLVSAAERARRENVRLHIVDPGNMMTKNAITFRTEELTSGDGSTEAT